MKYARGGGLLPAVLLASLGLGLALMPHSILAGDEQLSENGKQQVINYERSWQDDPKYPGPSHHRLQLLEGEWDSRILIWGDKNDTEPAEYTARTVRMRVLGGRFLEEYHTEYSGEDSVFQAIAYVGFNRKSGLFESMRMTSESTAMLLERGRYDSSNNAIVTRGSFSESGSGLVVQTRTVLKVLDPDSHSRTVYHTWDDGAEFKHIEITYTRRPGEIPEMEAPR